MHTVELLAHAVDLASGWDLWSAKSGSVETVAAAASSKGERCCSWTLLSVRPINWRQCWTHSAATRAQRTYRCRTNCGGDCSPVGKP